MGCTFHNFEKYEIVPCPPSAQRHDSHCRPCPKRPARCCHRRRYFCRSQACKHRSTCVFSSKITTHSESWPSCHSCGSRQSLGVVAAAVRPEAHALAAHAVPRGQRGRGRSRIFPHIGGQHVSRSPGRGVAAWLAPTWTNVSLAGVGSGAATLVTLCDQA